MNEISNDDRTSALGLFNYARSYRSSADHLLLAKLELTHAHAPLTFLFYHAIELYLKAYLRGHDYTVAKLKTVSHNIGKLAVEVQSIGLTIHEEDLEVLKSMAEADNIIRSRYIQTGAFTRPEEEALSRTCQALDESVSEALKARGLHIRPDGAVKNRIHSSTENEEQILEDIDELNETERGIIAYLLHHKHRFFTADLDGGHAATLISRGFIRTAARDGQLVDPRDVPMEIPERYLECSQEKY